MEPCPCGHDDSRPLLVVVCGGEGGERGRGRGRGRVRVRGKRGGGKGGADV